MEREVKKQSSEAECDCYLGDEGSQDVLHGVTCAGIIGPDDESGVTKPVVYTITEYSGGKRQDTRGCREISRTRGKKVPRIEKSALRDQLVILPGVAMSAADVVRALREYIKDVEEGGMHIGNYEGGPVIERIDGTLVVY
jgi:hypothetical protein